MKESDIQKGILDLLAAERVFHVRMNSGAMFGEHKGKKWAVRFGEKGMADILVIPKVGSWTIPALWIEVKNEKGKQPDDQKAFQARVEEEGHRYLLARSIDDVLACIRGTDA